MKKFKEINTFRVRTRTSSSTIMRRLRFQGYPLRIGHGNLCVEGYLKLPATVNSVPVVAEDFRNVELLLWDSCCCCGGTPM